MLRTVHRYCLGQPVLWSSSGKFITICSGDEEALRAVLADLSWQVRLPGLSRSAHHAAA